MALTLSEAEILVLLAIDGNGADAIAACIAGMHPFSGRIEVGRRALSPAGDPRAFRAAGGRYVPADRRAEGLIPTLTLAENLALPNPPGRFLIDRRVLFDSASSRIARFGVRAASPSALAAELSGGNQQKLVLARELDASSGEPRLLVAIHPTRGLDIAASADVHDRIEEARRNGCAVLVVNSDPDEARLFGGTFRVVYRGILSEPLSPSTPFDVLGRRMAGLAA